MLVSAEEDVTANLVVAINADKKCWWGSIRTALCKWQGLALHYLRCVQLFSFPHAYSWAVGWECKYKTSWQTMQARRRATFYFLLSPGAHCYSDWNPAFRLCSSTWCVTELSEKVWLCQPCSPLSLPRLLHSLDPTFLTVPCSCSALTRACVTKKRPQTLHTGSGQENKECSYLNEIQAVLVLWWLPCKGRFKRRSPIKPCQQVSQSSKRYNDWAS